MDKNNGQHDDQPLGASYQPLLSAKPKVTNPNLAIASGEMLLHDAIASENVEVDFDFIKVNNVYYRTIFIAGYPRFVAPGWLEPVVNFN